MALYWRVFPWDRRARAGEPFSASYIPPTTARGRFDLPIACSPVLYLAETPDHAIAESIQPWRNQLLRSAHLLRARRPLALVDVQLAGRQAAELVDLCDPEALRSLRLRPDQIASRHRRSTQAIAASIWDSGNVGLRWWSSFWGDWHGAVLFWERAREGLHFGKPRIIDGDTPALRVAAAALGVTLAV